jgi:SNF2 family DNA or RNA helicase
MENIDCLSGYFSEEIRSRGLEYYKANRITILKSTPNLITIIAKGTKLYRVILKLESKEIDCECSCPHFEQWGPCKHIWAAFIKASHEKLLAAVIASTPTIFFSGVTEADKQLSDNYSNDSKDETIDSCEQDCASCFDRFECSSSNINAISPFDERNEDSTDEIAPWKHLLFRGSQNSDFTTDQKKIKLWYTLDVAQNRFTDRPYLAISKKKLLKDGNWSSPERITDAEVRTIIASDHIDRKIMGALNGSAEMNYFEYGYRDGYYLSTGQMELLLPLIAGSGKLNLKSEDGNPDIQLRYDHDSWEFKVTLKEFKKNNFLLAILFVKGNERIESFWTAQVLKEGYLIQGETISPFNDNGASKLLNALQRDEHVIINLKDIPEFITEFYSNYERLPLDLPDSLNITNKAVVPVPVLRMVEKQSSYKSQFLHGELYFDYEGKLVAYGNYRKTILSDKFELTRINSDLHNYALEFLESNGVTISKADSYYTQTPLLKVRQKQFVQLVSQLIKEGWRVEGKKMQFKVPGKFSFSVTSGIDWFDVDATCEFGDEQIDLPEILKALKKGEQFVTLDDGSMGILPEEWLRKYAPLANMGEVKDEIVRFKKSQALIVDLLLSEQTDAKKDLEFGKICEELHSFDGVIPGDPAPSFKGVLRPYQRDGLGWFAFLQKFGLGGCLADDMGLGKTIQVLALLDIEKFRYSKKRKKEHLPSIVVVPRSLIFNWIQESARFTPALTICDFSGAQRNWNENDYKKYDIILITYGTLRADVEVLHRQEFNYVILDEAQVIKNAASITAKAARLLKGRHRLAMSGTPVENHLGELWSIFEFLNPGMLGSSTLLNSSQSLLKKPNEEVCEILRKVLHPFILRRTKKQVATDLPERTEEVILCEMEPKQRELYDELRAHYRASLVGRIKKDGIKRSKIQILEALLRLRQAACHPGLIEKKYSKHPSVKLDTVIAQINEVIDGGHKCLVFSQFTSMLAIVRQALDGVNVEYEYLDGQTTDRQAHVERFQNDTLCKVFLISLKAGGVGLNLTAAEYVFILDPWWNPAVEAQAIDRTHRIGQTRPVFAYRLICKDTVEEKILDLQSSKRKLAESVISADESLLKNISMRDLEVLFG